MSEVIDPRLVIRALWRRRYLLCVPLLLMVPLSLLIAAFGPRTYVATSLILLQEEGRNNPLAKDDTAYRGRMQERIAGLAALAKSDHVLSRVMKEILGDTVPTSPIAGAQWKADFEENLSLELIGTDFVALSLKSNNPKALGRRVAVLTTALLEALLAEESTLSATQMLLEKRKEELDVAERDYARYKARLIDLPSRPDTAIIDATRQQSPQRIDDLKKPQADVESARASVSENNEIEEVSKTKPVIDRAGIDQVGKTLARAVEEARNRYATYAKRYTTPASQMLGVLSAPERIKVIDLPSDPELPVSGGVSYAVAGIIGSLGLAFGLVLVAELLDPTVRRAREFEVIAGAPVLARLP